MRPYFEVNMEENTIFSFYNEVEYIIIIEGGYKFEGVKIIDVKSDGIITDSNVCIPTAHILFFEPIIK